MAYGDDTNIPGSEHAGLSDGAKLGILAGVLGLTGLAAWAYSDRGPLGASKTAKGSGGPTFPIGSEDWAQWQSQHNPSTYTHPAYGAPGGGVRHAGHGALEADHRAQGGNRTYICGGGETPAFIAAKYGRTSSVGDLVSANPGLDVNTACAAGTQIVIPDAWPLMGA